MSSQEQKQEGWESLRKEWDKFESHRFLDFSTDREDDLKMIADWWIEKLNNALDSVVEKVNRVEVINHDKPLEEGGGRAYVYWDTTNQIKVELSSQDEGRTLKVFISPRSNTK